MAKSSPPFLHRNRGNALRFENLEREREKEKIGGWGRRLLSSM